MAYNLTNRECRKNSNRLKRVTIGRATRCRVIIIKDTADVSKQLVTPGTITAKKDVALRTSTSC